MKKFLSILNQTARGWQKDKAMKEGAALAFYTVLSLPAFLLLIVSGAGIFIDTPAAAVKLANLTALYIGPVANQEIQTMLQTVSAIGFGSVGAIVSVAVLIWSASSIAGNLQNALNNIWNIAPAKRGWKVTLRNRLKLFLMLVVAGLLFLAVVLLQTLLPTVLEWTGQLVFVPPLILAAVQWLFSLALLIGLFAIIYKFVPQARISGRDAIIGGTTTAILFTLGNALISWYIGRSNLSLYGTAGSLMALLLWIYYSSVVIFIGAEFTQAYATAYGRSIISTDMSRWRRWLHRLKIV